ncbi:MAG: DUF6421 family protein [Nocardioides sp.]
MASTVDSAAALFKSDVVPAVNLIRSAQFDHESDAIRAMIDNLCSKVAQLEPLMARDQILATVADLQTWASTGLTSRPSFSATRDTVPAPEDRQLAAFVGPAVLPNNGGVRPRLEAFAILRQETDHLGELTKHYPHPKAMFQSTKILSASNGLHDGNCVVFFPENIPADIPCDTQNFAWFFFDRHREIYQGTLEIVRRLCGEGSPFDGEDELGSTALDAEGTYQARCVWGYLHDYFHHRGPRPLDEHLRLKTRWRTGLLEELKVDTQTAIACASENVPLGDVVFEYVLLERLFRYPAQPDQLRNFDAGSGFALGTWLAERGLFSVGPDGTRRLAARDELVVGMSELVNQILALEAIADDTGYRDAAEEFLFQTLLNPPMDASQRYAGPRAPLGLWVNEVEG